MPKDKMTFKDILKSCEAHVLQLGINIDYTKKMEPFFKGDLDGKTIFINKRLSKQEKLFNLLHLTGHTIQWNIDNRNYELGKKLIKNPSAKLLKKLQKYEWNANRFGLYILRQYAGTTLDKWYLKLVKSDMAYLTYYYKTGKKEKVIITDNLFPFKDKKLKPKTIPAFIVKCYKNSIYSPLF